MFHSKEDFDTLFDILNSYDFFKLCLNTLFSCIFYVVLFLITIYIFKKSIYFVIKILKDND